MANDASPSTHSDNAGDAGTSKTNGKNMKATKMTKLEDQAADFAPETEAQRIVADLADDAGDPADAGAAGTGNADAAPDTGPEAVGAGVAGAAGAGAAGPDSADEDAEAAAALDPAVPVTVEQVKKANLDTKLGKAIVTLYNEQQLLKLNREIGYLVIEGRDAIVRVGANALGELGMHFVSVGAERTRLANRPRVAIVKGGEHPYLKWERVFDHWLEWPRRRSYDGAVFHPKGGVVAARGLPPYAKRGLAPLNLFVGTAWAPAPGDHSLIVEHIHKVLCGGQVESTRYVLNWMARMVQFPEKLAETVLVFQSGQGVGKGTVTNIFRRYFGHHGVELTNDRGLVGFNDQLAVSIFVSLNEAVWGGDKKSEGTLKSLVTDREITVERKYLPQFMIQNCVHLIVSSNNEWVAPIGHDDRRYVVLNPSHDRVGDVAYFTALRKSIDNGGDRAFIDYLMKRDVNAFNPRVLPTVLGERKLEQKLQTADSVAQWLHGLLDDGGLTMVDEDLGAMGGKSEKYFDLTREPIATLALYNNYRDQTRGSRPMAPTVWAKRLRKIMGTSVQSLKPRSNFAPTMRLRGGAQVPCYWFNDLDAAREAFAQYMGETIDWQ